MSTEMSEEELYKIARKRVEEKKGFFIHFAVYIVVNTVLIIIWAVTGAPFPWFIFPLAGWGIGVLFHFLGVFFFSRQTEWDRRQIEKEVERLRKSKG
jgi:Na+(H+)/acetate symporter ActP